MSTSSFQYGNVIAGNKVDGDMVMGNKYIDQVPRFIPHAIAIKNMIAYYTEVFGGREDLFDALDTFLASNKPYAFLHAPTGRGKTALLINWTDHVSAADEWTVIFAPISIRYGTARADVIFPILATALADVYGEREQLTIYNQTPENLRALIARYLDSLPPNGRCVLVVIDGLDEAVGWELGLDLFPYNPPPHLRVVASAREMANTSRADWLSRLGWRNKQTASIILPELDHAAVSDILRHMSNPLDELATDVNLLAEIERVSQGDPLTIRLLVEGLQDGSLTPGKLTNLPPGLEPFVHDWLDNLQMHSANSAPIRAFLVFCTTALGPLTSADLEILAPEYFETRAVLNEAARIVARFVIGDDSDEQGYVFSHPRLRELFLERVLSKKERALLQDAFIECGKGDVLRDQALAAAREIANGRSRSRALLALMCLLPASDQAAMIHESLLAIRTINDTQSREYALACLMPHTTTHPDHTASATNQESARQQQTPPQQAYTAAQAFTDTRAQTRALLARMAQLPEDQRHTLLDKTRAVAHAIPNEYRQVCPLIELLDLMPHTYRQSILEEALAISDRIELKERQTKAYTLLMLKH